MEPYSRKSALACWSLAAALATSTVFAQAVSAPPQEKNETPIKLDPFNVNAAADVGFVAASSLAGGRIASALKDTPVAYSVMTKEFLDAFNITDLSQAAQFSVSSNYYEGDGSNQGFASGPAQSVRIRGQLANSPTRNFFPYATTADSFDLDRIDFARGANAILFGSGGAGGTQNSATKQATTARTIREVSAQIGSWERYRLTADINQPITEKLALRTNLLWASGDTWHQHEWEDRTGAHLAATYNLSSTFTIRGEYQYRQTKRLQGWQIHQDQLSAWDGKTSASGYNPAMTAAQLGRAGLARIPSMFIWRPEWGKAMNFQNLFQTTGAAYNATFANTNYLDNQPIRTVGFTLRNQPMIDFWTPANRYASVARGSAYFTLPKRDDVALWDSENRDHPTYTETGRDAAVYFTYTPFKDLSIELAGDTNQSPKTGNNSGRRNLLRTLIDVNRTLPTGEPNSHFLQQYNDYEVYENLRDEQFDNVRLQSVYAHDTRFGKLQLGVMGGWQKAVLQQRMRFLLLPLFHLGPDFRTFVSGSQSNEYAIYTRLYQTDGDRNQLYPSTRPLTLVDPVTNVTSVGAPRMVYDPTSPENQLNSTKLDKFFQAAGNFDLFKNKLVLVGAFRRDFQNYSQLNTVAPGDLPAGWDGTSIQFLPTAPADYQNLTYVQKNAAGVPIGPSLPADARPRVAVNGVQVRAPQYANDRFRDDYSPPEVGTAANTWTMGFVFNATRWLGLYANKSTTFNLSAPLQNLDNSLNPPTSSEGKDAGVRITLPNGKLAVSLGWYSAYQEGSPIRIITGLNTAINAIYAAPIVGDLSVSGQNIRGLKSLSSSVWSTSTSITKGYEAEMTANLTPNWRWVLNFSYNDSEVKDPYPDHPAFIARTEPVMRQVLADSGVLINSSNVAFINPQFDDPTKINQAKVQAAVDGWNTYQTTVLPNLAISRGQPVKSSQTMPYSGNVATDYRFSSGRLAGLRAGIAVNYRSAQIIGTRSGDTIPDPNNPLNAIDDPATDATSYVYGSAIYKGTGTLSYTMKLQNGGRAFAPKSIQFDLTIDNLFRRHAPIYGFTNATNNASSAGVILVPRNNDISNPSRMSVPGNPTYLPPMSYTLSAKLSF